MIRKIAYLLVISLAILTIFNLTLSHSLASEGQNLSRVYHRQTEQKSKIASLHEAIMVSESIYSVSRRAQELGFTDRIKVMAPETIDQPAIALRQ